MSGKNYKLQIIAALFAALATFLVFFTARDNQFVALDDYAYIINNPNIVEFGWKSVFWALTSFCEGNWHPLTMLSYILDRHFWGVTPKGYIVTNVLIHSCTVFVSCFLFSRLLYLAALRTPRAGETATPGGGGGSSERSIIVGGIAGALFFGIHPLRVESVVWVSERKDVLFLFFMVTSLWMYLTYAIKRGSSPHLSSWRSREYAFALLLALLSMMSKPAAVTLPLVFCIIDWYPLNRIADKSAFLRILAEKIPFFIISAIGVLLTLLAQQIAMDYAPDIGLFSRLLVACKALLFYISATIWPSALAAFYMHPGNVASTALPEYLLYLLLVVIVTASALLLCRKQRFWAAFWLFYVVTLLPMLGLIQVGGQWAADRYSYLPALGIALLWGGFVASSADSAKRSLIARLCLLVAVSQMLFYTVQTLRQIPVWRNTETLANRIIERSPHQSGAPYLARAIYRNEAGRYEEALADIGKAMNISLRRGLTRTYSSIAFQHGLILKNLGRYPEALAIVEWGIETSVDPPPQDALELRDELALLKSLGEGKSKEPYHPRLLLK